MKTKKLDQYGSPIPEDLVSIGDPSDYTAEQLKKLDLLDWYEVRGTNYLFASANKIQSEVMGDSLMDFYGPEEFGLEHAKFNKVESVLHRWTQEDGFYHA